MATDNPFMLTLADIPSRPAFKANSIIAIKGNDQPPMGGWRRKIHQRPRGLRGVGIHRAQRHSCQMNPLRLRRCAASSLKIWVKHSLRSDRAGGERTSASIGSCTPVRLVAFSQDGIQMNQKHNQHQNAAGFFFTWPLARRHRHFFARALIDGLRAFSSPLRRRMFLRFNSAGGPHGTGRAQVVQHNHAVCRHVCGHDRPRAMTSPRHEPTRAPLTVLRWKLGQSTAAYVNATWPEPGVNAAGHAVNCHHGPDVIQD